MTLAFSIVNRHGLSNKACCEHDTVLAVHFIRQAMLIILLQQQDGGT